MSVILKPYQETSCSNLKWGYWPNKNVIKFVTRVPCCVLVNYITIKFKILGNGSLRKSIKSIQVLSNSIDVP